MIEEFTEIEDVEWENAARKLFYECLTSSSSSSTISSFSSLSSTASRVTVKTLVDYIRNNASGIYRNKHLLDELQKSIEEVSWDDQVNYTLFKKASRRWVAKIQNDYNIQDGNNNVSKDNNSSCAMSDTTPESADDTDSGCGVPVGIGEISQADLRLRVRRSDEENSLLREDLATAEELAAGLQRQLENLQQKLDDKKEKYRQLEHENDRYQELLQKAEQKERDCRWALQKLDKEKSLLATKIDDAEAKKQQITLLNSKLERCKKEKYDCIREATLCKRELEDKQRECELLKEQLAQMIEVNKNLQESYDKTIQCLRDNVQELKDQKFGLRETESIGSSSDDFLSTSPSGHFQSYTHSTSYSNSGLQDSLYDELKASGFSAANESRVRELEDELSWYGEEIHRAVDQINDVTQRLCHKRSIPHVPDLNLNDIGDTKIPEISLFLRKITELSNMVNEIIRRPKVKDACSQLRVDANHTNELLSSEFGIRSFEDQLRFVKEKTELETNKRENSNFERETDVFVNAFSMNTRLLGESSENKIEISTEQSVDSRDNDNFSTTSRDSMSTDVETHEHPIIDPIVQEIERILQCTNKSEEEPTVNSPILKNPRYRCIYTTVDNSATDSTLNSPKRLQRDLASTYILSSGGDGLSLPTINNTNITTNTTEQMIVTILSDDSEKTEADSLTESMLKSRTLETTKIIDDQTIPEEIIDHELNIIVDEKSNSENFNSPPTSPRIIQHLSSTPRRNNANFAAKKAQPTNGEKSVAPSECLRNLPKRKISVFHRSFDIDTVHDETEQQQQQQQQTGSGIISSSETYRLTERSMSSPDERENCSIDTMELDPECMKMSLNTRKFLLNYRDKNEESDSSDASSPLKSMDNREKLDKPEVAIINRPRPLILAPTKLNLGSIAKIPPYVGSEKNPVKINDEDSGKIVNQTRLRETKNLAANEKELRNEEIRENCEKRENNENSNEKETTEIIRPGDEIERGVTCRKTSFSRELNISDYSLISQMEQDTRVNDQVLNEKTDCMTRVIFQSDSSESTSCESSPKRENLRFQANSKPPLLSTYEIPRTRERNYARQDPSMPRGTWYDSVEEAVRGYQTKNEIVPTATTTSVGNYDGVITGTIIRDGQQKQDVKAKSVKIPAVALAMSSGEDSSDSECDPMAIRENDNINSRCNVVNETRSISPTVLNFVDGALLGTSTPAPTNNNNNKNQKNNNNDNVKKPKDIEDCETKKAMDQKREKRERPHTIRRSLSENGCGLSESRCRLTNASTSQDEFNKEETRPNVFPSLTDVRLQESGIAKLPSNDEIGGNLPEADLERKYMALSVGLVTDRVTLPRRVALSIRQRDQSERNLSCEVQKMHQDIQDLAPLCIDRESVERVERVRHQLEMITQCAHRVSCTAETLGAVHQENRISRAILLADRYLLVLRSRCEKLALDLTETKRILTENNIVIEEHNGEFGDDMPRTRYRGVPITNRTMMARRRASIATIFRPLGNFQDVTKDGLRQRNSVSGRVTLRRPSLSAESQKWEAEKLDRTDSSSSIGELREIFEQAESRRNSREENNNNVLRLHSSNLSIRDCDNGDIDVWTNAREEPVTELSVFVDGGCHESRNGRRTPLPQWMTNNNAPWKTMLWCIIISFFFGFYVKHAVSSTSECTGTHLKWWSIEEILERYLQIKKDLPRPI